MNNVLRLVWLAIFFLAPVHSVASENSLRDALRSQVFNDVQNALEKANAAAGSVLTPETYRQAGELYERADKAFADGADVDRVRKLLFESTRLFEQAASMAPTVENFVSAAFQARKDALESDAAKRSQKLWLDAEKQLYEATSRAEKGREQRVSRYADKAELLYRDSELAAIETVLFTEIETEIAQARKLDAHDWAPRSYNAARELLKQARSVLEQNRYDTDQPRNLANRALHKARHAQYIAKLANAIDDNDTNLENVLIEWQDTLAVFGERFDIPLYFDEGPTQPIALVDAIIEDREKRRVALEQEAAALQQRTYLLQDELVSVQAELENREFAKARLDRRLDQQRQREQSLARVDGLFSKTEAEVLRAENRLIIRLVGLGFSSGSAEVEKRHEPLLARLMTAMAEFPQTPVTIEGHTDSYGVDTSNLELSVRRAEAVASYLLENSAISPTQLSSVGFGETKPIANNETSDGRWKNRRIDVVLYPSWFSG
ncbi:MAG: OmpA family protein [Gammaproteobacteria bacterium]|nr:OmpA family protein [Gammaproteobacteria bacterium]